MKLKNTNFTNTKVLFNTKRKVVSELKLLNNLLDTKMTLKKTMFLCIMLPKMNAYRRDLKETQYMSFLTKDNEL